MRGSVPPTTGWSGFSVWALVGALFSLSVLGAASIGLFVLPVAVVALVLACVFVRAWPEITGLLEGAAALSLFVGMANLHATPCPSSGSGAVHIGRPGEGTFSCGGLDPMPWLLVGTVLAGAGLISYSLARLRS